MAFFFNPEPSIRRLTRLAGLFMQSGVFRPAMLLFALIVTFVVVESQLQKQVAVMQGKVVTAVEYHHSEEFSRLITWVGLSYGLLTLVVVTGHFFEDNLKLLLRRGMTEFLIDRYLDGRAYLRLVRHPEVDNPDQRITEDVRTLTDNALAVVVVFFRAALFLYSFLAILYSITPRLVWASLVYSAVGSLLTLLIGKRLIRLNINQLHKEADLRFELVRTREHAEAIALQRDEGRHGPRLLNRLGNVVHNMRRIIAGNALLGLFTNPFTFLQYVVVVLIVAPLAIADKVELGKIAEAIPAFTFVVNAFSIFVTEFPKLTLLTATVARLGELTATIAMRPKPNGLKVIEDGDMIEVRALTLTDPVDGHRFFGGQRLGFKIERHEHTLIVGKPGSGKSELMRALAELWSTGHGWIVRPPLNRIAFVSQQPYLTPNTLRQMLSPDSGAAPSDQQLLDALATVNLDELAARAGGLDSERDWAAMLALNERQALALARVLLVKPTFALLNDVTGSLESDIRRDYYERLAAAGVTVVTISSRKILPEFHKQFIPIPGGTATAFSGPAAA